MSSFKTEVLLLWVAHSHVLGRGGRDSALHPERSVGEAV